MRMVSWLARTAALVLAAGGNAQQTSPLATSETQTGSGLHSVYFHLPAGTINVMFPDDLAAGDTISGTVLPEPSGATAAERQSNSGELSGYVVDVERTKTSVPEKTFRWSVPPTLAAGAALVVLRNPNGDLVAQSPIPVGAPVPARGSSDFDLPTTGTAGGMVSVRGPFDGDSRTTVVTVGDSTATVWAESPRKIVFQPPAGKPGISTLAISKGDFRARALFRTIGLLLSATNLYPTKGQTSILTVTVQGLKDLTEPADLLLLNQSPSVVAMQGGAELHFVINPGQVHSDGTYTQVRTLKAIRGGSFNISAIAGRQPTLQFDLTRVVDRAVLDWQKSTGVPITPEAQRLIAASVMEDRKPLDDFLRLQEARRGDPASITEMLVRNYCFDLRDGRRVGAAGVALGHTGSMAFLPQPPKLAIDAKDVSGFSFSKFLAQLSGRLSPNQPVAYLLVSSRPDQAPISVDNHSGPDRTNRKFLVSAGTHTVVVNTTAGPCRKNVQVQAFQTGLVACL